MTCTKPPFHGTGMGSRMGTTLFFWNLWLLNQISYNSYKDSLVVVTPLGSPDGELKFHVSVKEITQSKSERTPNKPSPKTPKILNSKLQFNLDSSGGSFRKCLLPSMS